MKRDPAWATILVVEDQDDPICVDSSGDGSVIDIDMVATGNGHMTPCSKLQPGVYWLRWFGGGWVVHRNRALSKGQQMVLSGG